MRPTARDRLIARCDAADFDAITQKRYAAFVSELPEDEFMALLVMHDQYAAQPISGYRDQSEEAIASVNAVKEIEEHVLRLLDELKADQALSIDGRWLATGRTQIELGFMAVNRSITKPGRVDILDPEPPVESGWLIERADSDPDRPLFYAPSGGHGAQWSEDSEEGLRFTREADAHRLALALAIECRVAEHMWA